MFILPLMAILLGLEFYLVFERTTNNYETTLTEDYRILVVSKTPLELEFFQDLNEHIITTIEIERKGIVSNVAEGISKDNANAILNALPYFYNIGLDAYLETSEIEKIKQTLESNHYIKRVETFGSSHSSNYKLFSFIKLILEVFILFMTVVSLFLIMKQMEIWKYAHKERMQIMETFGAPMMLRSGVLFRVAFFDAIIATICVSILFFYIKYSWASQSGIDMIVKNRDVLFQASDIMVLFISAIVIVILAVYSVVFSSKGVED